MGPVAQRRLGCLFTCTEKNAFVGIRRPFQWQERRALMRTVTKRLVLRMAAGAPPIGLIGLYLDGDGGCSAYFRFTHDRLSLFYNSATTCIGLQPGLAAGLCQFAHPQNIALPFGHRNDPARIEQIEHMARFDALVISGQDHQMLVVARAFVEKSAALPLRITEMGEQHIGVGIFEIMA